MRIVWSGFVVDRDHIAIRVTKAECAPEGSIGRGRYDLDTCLRQRVVDVLGIFGVKPKSYAEARSWFCCAEINSRKRLAHSKRNGLGGKDCGTFRAVGCAIEAEMLLVELRGFFDVVDLQSYEVRTGNGHWRLFAVEGVGGV